MQLVLGPGLDAPEALSALSEALGRIRQQAEASGWEEVAAVARELARPVEDAAADPAAVEEAFKEGVARLQAAVEKGPARARRARR